MATGQPCSALAPLFRYTSRQQSAIFNRDAVAQSDTVMPMDQTFFEFFCGAGMARAGLSDDWKCLFANDFDPKKGVSYSRHWGEHELLVKDIRAVGSHELPGHPTLVWASFPCQDLSLAGVGAGLSGNRSGTFWSFWELVKQLIAEDRAPPIIALENVVGTLTSHRGADFAALLSAVASGGYRLGAMVIDAAKFLPQSRPRLFIVGVRKEVHIPPSLISLYPDQITDRQVSQALKRLPDTIVSRFADNLIWWQLPEPLQRNETLDAIIQQNPQGVRWHTTKQTEELIAMMSEANLAKLAAAKTSGHLTYGTIYKRTRPDGKGSKIQRAELRLDGIAGCLRTPAGGSSRQIILEVHGDNIRSRLISPREAARLMGLPESYQLPDAYNETYHLLGDGVAVPVVRYLANSLFEPIVHANTRRKVAA